MSANIVLTGLMGAGKSSIGKKLAAQLNKYKFIDIDEQIEILENMSIPEIFEQKSEEYFRELETKTIIEFSRKENQIISIGGGAFENRTNREQLLETGTVFYLYAPANVLYNRIKEQTNRPLLYCKNPEAKLNELLAKREINYKKAHHTIDTTNKTQDEITQEILRKI